ncbi:MAG: 30S ribosomal protein S6 [Acidobacteria bacterium]|nr:30S ribosomal protein S6 [Acidobacteriota bacterium]
MPLYELGLILDPETSPEQEAAALERIEGIVTKDGGEIVNKDAWGRRKLAYPIRKKTMGIYHFWRFNAEGSVQDPLAFELRTSDVVMRSLVLNLDRELIRKRKIERQLKTKAAKKAARATVTEDEPSAEETDV